MGQHFRYVSLLVLLAISMGLGVGWPHIVQHTAQTDPESREDLRRQCLKSMADTEKIYGDKPFDEWPQPYQRTYLLAKDLLRELDDQP